MMKHYVLFGNLESLFHLNFSFSYASRTKNIRNTPIINESSSYALLQQYAEEIQRLRAIINSSNKHTHSVSRSGILDDQHSIKTICDHQISSENSLIIKSII
jgi:hypothetical protein